MKSVDPRYFRLFLLVVFCFYIGCTSRKPTRLCENFQSYQSIEEVRAELNERGFPSGWIEESQGTGPTDRRPPYKFIYFSGPYRTSGFEGRLKFTFFDGRLMETQFSPQKSDGYMNAIRSENSRIPTKPAEEIVMDRRTRFRFNVGPDGSLTFTWYDPKLKSEWDEWVAENS